MISRLKNWFSELITGNQPNVVVEPSGMVYVARESITPVADQPNQPVAQDATLPKSSATRVRTPKKPKTVAAEKPPKTKTVAAEKTPKTKTANKPKKIDTTTKL